PRKDLIHPFSKLYLAFLPIKAEVVMLIEAVVTVGSGLRHMPVTKLDHIKDRKRRGKQTFFKGPLNIRDVALQSKPHDSLIATNWPFPVRTFLGKIYAKIAFRHHTLHNGDNASPGRVLNIFINARPRPTFPLTEVWVAHGYSYPVDYRLPYNS